MKELEEDFYILDGVSELQAVILANEADCVAFKESYDKYQYLWRNDLNGTLAEFVEQNGSDGDDPELDVFDAEIAKYKAVQEEISHLTTSAVIGWIRIDAKPMKQALATWVTKWVFLFTHYLSNKVVNSMSELYEFMARGDDVLAKDPTEANKDLDETSRNALLYEMMGYMRDLRKRQEKTDVMFEPLVATVALLKTYGISISEDVLKQLEEAPLAWTALKKKSLNVKEKLSMMQQLEARKIREASDAFAKKVEDFRELFQKLAPFAVKVRSAPTPSNRRTRRSITSTTARRTASTSTGR